MVLTAAACSGQNKTVLVPQKFQELLASKPTAQVLDVRTPEEFNKEHLQKAVNINIYEDDFKTKLSGLDKQKPVFVYCGSGVRSAKASGILKELGFKEVYDLQGGIKAWLAENLTVVR